jgi:hypothetical protein
VNPCSRLVAWTIAVLGLAAPSVAAADRVVLYPVDGRAEQDRLEQIEERISAVL